MPRVTLYSKADCHLCDVAKERVEDVRGRVAFDLEIVDISTSDELTAQYGERIPVVELDGEELFVYRVNPKVLEAKIGGGRSRFSAIRNWLRPHSGNAE